ncbi:PTS sugar transporter subunit IIA [Enterococcus canintestini]|uniref:PTS sugar transporter subunit IIA n=1 Tax=Enterococcus canintestini TaxID=317010 RepID=UPI002891D42C|nr:PTS sugar transporter subunit IIA [Enterococcus canintestini]MDT2739317.1 PTS sugar transporter subunit IIA [Enterococcus canintestini]
MKKVVIATHGNLAQGIQSTLELFVGKKQDITYISAYTQGQADLDTQIDNFFARVTPADEVIVFTDIYGGSVNQKFATKTTEENIFVVAGFNVPLLLEVILATEAISDEFIQEMITKAQAGMQQVKLAKSTTENDFFA